MTTAHADTFVRDRLPPAGAQPEFLFDLPELQYPELRKTFPAERKHRIIGRVTREGVHLGRDVEFGITAAI